MLTRKKLVLTVSAAALLVASSFIGIALFAVPRQPDSDQEIQAHVGRYAKFILDQQIKTFHLSQHLPTPKIILGRPSAFFYVGEYDPDKVTICISTFWTYAHKDSFINWLKGFHKWSSHTRPILSHELGHYYADQLSLRTGHGHWPQLEKKDLSDTELFGLTLVSEGMAVYFNRAINGGDDAFTDEMYPKKPDWSGWVDYDGGYHLIKPILDRYGERGMIYIMTHPPNSHDIALLPQYRANVLAALGK